MLNLVLSDATASFVFPCHTSEHVPPQNPNSYSSLCAIPFTVANLYQTESTTKMLWTSAKLLFSHENTLQQYFTAETNDYNQFQDPYLRKIPKSIFHQHSQHQNTVQVWFILQGSKWVVCGEGYGLYYTLWDQYVYQTTTIGPVTKLKICRTFIRYF